MTPNGEVTHDIYYQKYLKYKAKYLELKKLLGGGCPSTCSRGGKHSLNGNRICTKCGCRK